LQFGWCRRMECPGDFLVLLTNINEETLLRLSRYTIKMKRLAFYFVLCLGALSRADYTPTRIWWKGWRIESSEETSTVRVHNNYPLTFLFDGKPETAWVYSGKWSEFGKDWLDFLKRQWPNEYCLRFEPEKPIKLDSLRIMSGYNKSQGTFKRNDRIKDIEVWTQALEGDRRLIGKYRLEDRMGWQTISFKPHEFKYLVLSVKSRYIGTEHDLCISEIALMNRGKKVEMHMPKYVDMTHGDECGCCSDHYRVPPSGRMSLHDTDQPPFAVWGDPPTGIRMEDTGGRNGIPLVYRFIDKKSKKTLLTVKSCDENDEFDLEYARTNNILAVNEGGLTVYNLKTRRPSYSVNRRDIALCPYGKYFARSYKVRWQDYVDIFDVETGKRILHQKVKPCDNKIVWVDPKTVMLTYDPEVFVRVKQTGHLERSEGSAINERLSGNAEPSRSSVVVAGWNVPATCSKAV